MSWLLDGLRDAQRYAKRNPDMAQHVHDHPSGFMPMSPCPKDCPRCKVARKKRRVKP